ncbi:hypothetical protein [Priestia koreensis]|uniref:hypothetical protein n=1 Tax=Priestia koreensis TaxID=284581 RepID=UPI003457530E
MNFVFNVIVITVIMVVIYVMMMWVVDRRIALELVNSLLRVCRLHQLQLTFLHTVKRKYRKYELEIDFMLGVKYAQLKQYKAATVHFNDVFLHEDETFMYTKQLQWVLPSYKETRNVQDGKLVIEAFKRQIRHDARFEDVIKPYSRLFV